MKPKFFATAADFRNWLQTNHRERTELLVGFYKKGSGQPSITWPESVDAALCFGWIDGVRRRIDDVSYSIRFTPRKLRSIWSAVNIKRVEELATLELMQPAGTQAFEARQALRCAVYSFEQETVAFEIGQKKLFKVNQAAWKFFESQPASYRKAATWWVISAKREDTKERRLAALIADSADNRRLPHLTKNPK